MQCSSVKYLLGPSIINADMSRLADVCNDLLVKGADYLHLDVMDGHFVPNMTFGHPVVKCLRKNIPQNAFLDMHMMVSNPEKVGVGIKPGTNVEAVEPYIDEIDMVLIMTVEPGFGGQKFMSDMMPKLSYLRKKYPALNLEVDGGVSLDNIEQCKNNGANMFVCGTSIVGASDPEKVMKTMKQIFHN